MCLSFFTFDCPFRFLLGSCLIFVHTQTILTPHPLSLPHGIVVVQRIKVTHLHKHGRDLIWVTWVRIALFFIETGLLSLP